MLVTGEMGRWGDREQRDTCPEANSPLPPTIRRREFFYSWREGATCRNSIVSSDSYLEIGHWWSDQQHLVLSTVNLQFYGLLLLLLHRFSHVRLCATPEMAAHEALTSLGLSRQEHWSGLPFPSLMYESEKWKWSRSVMSNSSRPHELQPTRPLCAWDFPGKTAGVGCHCLLRFNGQVVTFPWGQFSELWQLMSWL